MYFFRNDGHDGHFGAVAMVATSQVPESIWNVTSLKSGVLFAAKYLVLRTLVWKSSNIPFGYVWRLRLHFLRYIEFKKIWWALMSDFFLFVKWLSGILESQLRLCRPCVRGAAGAAEVCAELHCCSAERLSLWAAMHSLLWPCSLVVPPQGMGGTVVAWPRAFSPVVVARFQSASLQVCWRWESYTESGCADTP